MTLSVGRGKTPGLAHPWVFLFIGVVTLCLTGCATDESYQRHPLETDYPVSAYVERVPFFPGEDFQCGPSVLASALNFFGYTIPPEEISKTVYLSELKGTLKMDMLSFIKHYEGDGRISATEVRGDIGIIKKDIISRYPVIVFVDLGFWNIRKGHYMLIVGYDDSRGGVIAYSGMEKDKFISYNHFMKMWERGGYWALRIVSD